MSAYNPLKNMVNHIFRVLVQGAETDKNRRYAPPPVGEGTGVGLNIAAADAVLERRVKTRPIDHAAVGAVSEERA